MKRKLSAAIAAILATATLAACSSGGDSPGAGDATSTADADNRVTVRVGVTDKAQEYWTTFTDLAAEEGIDVELVNFTDYTQPNPILSSGDLELNQFQHLLYLANYNVASDDDLEPIGSTAIYQLGLYTTKGYASPDDIPEGAEIAIPNDVVNQARALLVLQSAGLITLTDGGNAFSTPAEIDEAASRVKVVPVDANQTSVQLQSLDAAVINNNFATDAGIDPTTAIYSDLEDTDTARPYLNIWVARAEDKDNPVYAQLIEIYHSKEVTDQLLEENGGTAVVEDVPADELQSDLADLEDLVRESAA
ncbi:methionine ABC transporter substrate-binding protein [Cellulomonas hominis]|jgi:D-methionine transport system substrate-binding protein|uniref:D-methionine transport system substrate-binding protein n=2 Tax=Cellulomonas hominis TaxID=156981 RepID=A0A7W8SEP2_9CELL|nr:MetQ/NlpA family ABC transporter substrate-binding protein [Cellulomonas hominis]MBB5472650.1 D-methionine transport system substrate-binding protein [Cellulomonas hominis]MBU5421800.1 methionine ABC transporter substrate-binding protein [Cellulomonas hominis]NKY08528.1 methionine ABC transporter substrate-binding protein [Cellulomonas hominis]NKY11698.1 methionine ABC transporter substrate-binding protein [Cellulomonas hominis]